MALEIADIPLAVLSRALDQTGAVIARVRPEQATLPTPCRSWDVYALVNHVVDEVRQFAAVTGGGERNHLGVDVLGDDWAGAYRRAADSLRAAWQRPGAMDGTVRLPFGEVPAIWTIGQQITELAIHAWDIAKATGQPTDLDQDVARAAQEWGEANLKPEFRGDEADGSHIGPEIASSPDASLYDRLAAFGGRDPHLTLSNEN
ncbi:TIGR03086 family metal-binding protein [Acrocarpospora macrocephala]|uniref:TIGR03086 family protein n=1 Tax=Acrocarpospora macrocephala TaxID=150177 RepID=A0A5M3X7A4_9ACTN|nr:TIGR03086 family metal-binding protein [Acrocarpospora macrocephala]GES16984.1 TIGR03086 family protein [Acrocarpospora macrocephala]